MANFFDEYATAPPPEQKPVDVTVRPMGQGAPPPPPPAKDENMFSEYSKQPEEFQGVIPSLVHGIAAAPGAALRAPYEYGKSALQSLNPMSDERAYQEQQGVHGQLRNWLRTGHGLLTAAGIPFSPFIEAAKTAFGPAYGEALHDVGSLIAPETAAKDVPEQLHEMGRGAIETAAGALGARGGIRPVAAPIPPRPMPSGPLGVTLSEGQATGKLPAIQLEQEALRRGDPHATEFAQQQQAEVQQATENIRQGLDPYGQVVAETPQQAGQLVSEGVQKQRKIAKAGVQAGYKEAKELGGEIDAGAFAEIEQIIKNDLTNRADPVIINDGTPYARTAINDVKNRIANLIIKNYASPFGQPAKGEIAGITLEGVDQMRRRLSAWKNSAWNSGNETDGRAAQAVLDSFDNHIDNAINSGFFRGDPSAVKAWNNARAANADYRATYGRSSGKGNDAVQRVIQKILGNRQTPDPAIPNDVADFLHGSSGINPNSLNVAVAKRVKGILGEESPEWSGVRQGLFSRIIEKPEGVKDWGPQQIANRVSEFLNGGGKELSEQVFHPYQRALLQAYADLNRKLAVPQAGANWPNTARPLMVAMERISRGIGALIGGYIGHKIMPGWGMGEVGGAYLGSKGISKIREIQSARQLTKQMPLVATQFAKWQKAVNRAQRLNQSPQNVQSVAAAAHDLEVALKKMGVPSFQSGGRVAGNSRRPFQGGGAVDDDLQHIAVMPPMARAPKPVEDIAAGAAEPLLSAGNYLGGIMQGSQQFSWPETVQKAGTLAMAMAPGPKGERVAGAVERGLAAAAPDVAQGIRAYHGSPHDFEKFDIGKIGTGEGAQAYGHGLYFAENENVAKSYRDALSGRSGVNPNAFNARTQWLVNGEPMPSGISGHAALDTAGDIERLVGMTKGGYDPPVQQVLRDRIERRVAQFKQDEAKGYNTGSAGEDMRALADYYDQHIRNMAPENISQKPPGKLYEVNIKANPEHFLDWDKPLSQQSQHVRDALRLGEPGNWSPSKGRLLRSETLGAYVPEHAETWEYARRPANAEQMAKAGIAGVRYLDQGSRGASKQIHFLDQDIGNLDLRKMPDNVTRRALSFARGDNNLQDAIDSAWAYDKKDIVSELERLRDSGQLKDVSAGTHNYVVFNHDIIDIIKKYGIAGLIAAGAYHARRPADGGA